MTDKTKYLYDNPQIAEILSAGFAKVCYEKPKFPINYLANFLKNYNINQKQKVHMIDKLQHNKKVIEKLEEQSIQLQNKRQQIQQKSKNFQMEKAHFLQKIHTAKHHEQVLDLFCQWVQDRFKLTGVYIGELQHDTKKINLQSEDSQQAHLELEKEKIIKYKYSSQSHKRIVIGKTISQDSVAGRLLNQKIDLQGEGDAAEGGQQAAEGQEKKAQNKGEIYINSVVGNNQLIFFRFPKLGAFYSVSLTVRNYLRQKLLDENIVKIQTYNKVLQQFQKEHQQKYAKFKQLYDQKVNSGAQQKQLQQMQKQFQQEQAQVVRPQMPELDSIERKFVVSMDTLGQDRQITEAQRSEIKQLVNILRQAWQKQEKKQLEEDINRILKLRSQHTEPTDQQQFTTILEQEQKDIPTHQQVQKVNKDNEKLLQLEMNTIRVEKAKEYLGDQKYLPYWETLLEMNVIKYPQIIKHYLIFLGLKKEQFCLKGTNILNWQKAKSIFQQNKSKFGEAVAGSTVRGSKPFQIYPYAKWQRIIKNLQSFDQATVSSYNLYLAFILRYLQISGKTRIADRQARVASIKNQREQRQQKIKDSVAKQAQKQQKLLAVKAQAQQKQQAFDEAAWLATYQQQNPLAEIPDQIPDDIDKDLQDGDSVPEVNADKSQ